MHIDKKYKLEKAVSTDSMKASLQNIYVTRRHASACNSNILAIVPVTSDKDDTPGWLTPDALKLGRKAAPRSFGDIMITLNGSQILPDGTILKRPNEEVPPRYVSIIRQALRNNKFTVGINVKLLKDLSDALGTEAVVMTFETNTQAIVVRPLHSNAGELGIIMPVRVNP